jgi:hypothetical protein
LVLLLIPHVQEAVALPGASKFGTFTPGLETGFVELAPKADSFSADGKRLIVVHADFSTVSLETGVFLERLHGGRGDGCDNSGGKSFEYNLNIIRF